ncbi:phosphoenolpyruvate carboxylase [Noviherbaspirillum aerium]|uniref:phosphoenolpyruvate carboxylase n=1 Tax=Noviherbaspirillum aerium TaxID=2588497 RepID=UPI00124F22D8|nr:phosphoenolpyruvate carboxylase [Noviherbaspirillum aerium]
MTLANGLPEEVQIDLGRPWHDLIHGQDRVNALRAFEWATLFGLRVALRNGSVCINHSFSFRSRTTLLIPSTGQTRVLRSSKLSVLDEVENGLSYFDYTMLAELPRLYACLEDVLAARIASNCLFENR